MRAEEVLARDEREARSLRNKASQELSRLEAQSQWQAMYAGDTSSRASPEASEYEEHMRELESLQLQRMRLMERVQSLEQETPL